jgi:iron(III) transport system substrate-binding protein
MLRDHAIRFAALVAAAGLFVSPLVAAAATPGGLVIDGVEIADAATYDAAKKEGRLLLYSTFESHGMAQITAKFTADTGLPVDVIRLPSAEMFDRATSEFSTHRLSADWVDTTDVTLTQQLADRGILRGYKVPDFGTFESVLRDGDGKWYSILRSTMAIGINTALVKPADVPSKWTDLMDPKWKGKIGFGNIDAGGTAYSFWFFYRQRYGMDAWRKIAAQTPRIGYSAQPVANDLARGETVIAVDPIESMLAGIASGSPIKIILPPGGPSYGIIGGMTSVAPHPHGAEVWLNWITSKRAASVLGGIGTYSVRRDAPTPTVAGVAMPPPGSIYNIRASDYVRLHASLVKDWHAVFTSH